MHIIFNILINYWKYERGKYIKFLNKYLTRSVSVFHPNNVNLELVVITVLKLKYM